MLVGDLALDGVPPHFESVDAVVHCAGSPTVGHSIADPDGALPDERGNHSFCARVGGPAGARHSAFLLASSAAVYGDSCAGPASEDITPAPISPYGRSKVLAEELCREFGARFGVKSIVIRFFSLYGRGLRKQLLWDACRKLMAGDCNFRGTGREIRDFLTAEDAASLCETALSAATKDVSIVNGGTGEGVTVSQVLGVLNDELHCGSEPCFDGVSPAGDPQHLVADIRKARELGWVPRTRWHDGVRDYVRWVKAQKAQKALARG